MLFHRRGLLWLGSAVRYKYKGLVLCERPRYFWAFGYFFKSWALKDQNSKLLVFLSCPVGWLLV